MRHTIEGTCVCISGTLDRFTHAQAHRAIERAGGTFTTSVVDETDILVCSMFEGTLFRAAQARGIPIIDEDQFLCLLRGEPVAIDEARFALKRMPNIIGEARSLLGGPITSATWSAIIEMVDACAPEQLDELIDYLEPQVARWQPKPHERWIVDGSARWAEEANRRWLHDTPLGELRAAPYHWVVDMAFKVDSPKQRLIRAVHTTGMKLDGTMLSNILSRPNLTHLRFFDTANHKPPKTFFKRLRTEPSTRTLEHFRFIVDRVKTAAGIVGEHHLEALDELTLHHIRYDLDLSSLKKVLASDACAGCSILNVEGFVCADMLRPLDDPDVMPNLHTVGVFSASQHIAEALESCGVFGRVDTLRIAPRFTYLNDASYPEMHDDLSRCFQMLFPKITHASTLDLSFIQPKTYSPHARFDFTRALHEALLDAALPECVGHMTLGPWHDDAVASSLGARYGVEVGA